MLKPEKLRGKLTWHQVGRELVLQHGAIVVAIWSPFAAGVRGMISIYGEPHGKSMAYKTWLGWTTRVWEAYRMKTPKGYVCRLRPGIKSEKRHEES